MKDHVYFLKHGYLYTTPCIACRMNMKFYAAILLAADSRPFRVEIGGRKTAATALILRAGSCFSFAADENKHVSIFIEPTHPEFGRFRSVPDTGLPMNRASFGELDDALHNAYDGSLSAARAHDLFENAVKTASRGLPRQPPLDPRIERVLQLMQGSSAHSLEDLSAILGVSYYRLSHLFSANLGISLRQFMQWRKVTMTASLLATRSITEVAHEAGFTDSAHLSRTFQDIYGIPPSYLNDVRCVERFYFQGAG